MLRNPVWQLSFMTLMLVAALPAAAQSGRPQASVRTPRSPHQVGVTGHVFVPGFGLRPVIRQSGVPVFGLGFDAHHFFATRPRQGFVHGFHPGFGAFIGSGFHTRHAFGFGFIPFVPFVGTTPTVVVVQQTVPVEVPVPVFALDDSRVGGSIVVAGLPEDWPQWRLAVAADSRPVERAPLPPLTLLVLKDDSILPASEYWLEDGLVFYVTSTGRQGSFELRELDWEMTARLNAERNVEFVLRSPR